MINSNDVVATEGTPTKLLATMFAKAAMTRSSVTQANMLNNFLPVSPIVSSITLPMDLLSCRTEAKRDAKSWTPPRKILPTTIQRNTGTQPNIAAEIGPTIGPAPAMDAKC